MQPQRHSLSILAIAGSLSLMTVAAHAAKLNVPSQYPTIQAAINAAAPGDTIIVAAGTYYERLNWTKNLTIKGAGPNKSIVDANGTGPCLITSNLNGSSRLEAFMFINGRSTSNKGGGMRNTSSSPTVTRCTFRNNSAGQGGGMSNDDWSTPLVTDCKFEGNSGVFGGGMSLTYNSHATLIRCTFTNNTASENGGGLYTLYSKAAVSDCTFDTNSATWDGGGVYNYKSLPGDYLYPTYTRCTFIDNSSVRAGGGMYNNYLLAGNGTPNKPLIVNCTFKTNYSGSGGGIYNNGSSPYITNGLFIGNTSYRGGAIHNYYNSWPDIVNCTIVGNEGFFEGGAICNKTSGPLVANSIIWGNAGEEVANDDASSVSYRHSIVDGMFTEVPDLDGNLSVSPLFVNPEAADYRLRPESIGVNAGANSFNTTSPLDPTGCYPTALDGGARFSGIAMDMGAYEISENSPPVLTIPAAANVSVASSVTVQASATDPDGNAVTFGLVNAPSWASINATTGVITFAPPAGVSGVISIEVKANDTFLECDHKTIALTVCPLMVTDVVLTKSGSWTTVKFNLLNTGTTNVKEVSVNGVNLRYRPTTVPMPITFPQIKAGLSKLVTVRYYNMAAGPAPLQVLGTSLAGPFASVTNVVAP